MDNYPVPFIHDKLPTEYEQNRQKREQKAHITLLAFGFKYGMPPANYYFDVGFAKNPARDSRWTLFSTSDWNDEMKNFVLGQEAVRDFIDAVIPLIKALAQVDAQQVFAFGCSAGRHRSVVIAREIGRRLTIAGYEVELYRWDFANMNWRALLCM